MNLEIFDNTSVYEIQLEPITQLCGIDIRKKNYIIQSLCKYFSNSKYSFYEESMINNVHINGEKIGRKYFSLYYINSREKLINSIKISKTSLMSRFLNDYLTTFKFQGYLDGITKNLDSLYFELNKSLESDIKYIELCYQSKNFMEIVQSSEIYDKEERALDFLSNIQLLQTYLDILQQLQKSSPEKSLIIIENIDHLLNLKEFISFYERIENFSKEYDSCFILTTSIEGFVILNEQSLEGVNVINDIIFHFPKLEYVLDFINNNYPLAKNWKKVDIFNCCQNIIHNIGCRNYKINLKSNLYLKLLNETVCIETTATDKINNIENTFLFERNMI